ncbi:M24 family metallopeptidase [Marinomonas sp. 5E14-1]|uniref:type I methionyl aminopeptidase n=1 Tax=Marinomonas sp. 5E14-1 TaxID=3153922 RepID=UPI0032659383
MQVQIKNTEEIELMRESGKLLAQVFHMLDDFVKEGVSTLEINDKVEGYTRNTLHSRPASLGQYGYEFALNASINDVVCHGIPKATQVLKAKDIVREYCGHGVGREMHEEPQVLHYGKAGTGLVLVEGMTFAIEPMINQEKAKTKTQKDGWTVVTADKKLSAQWEHTILVTQTGYEVLTLRQEEQATEHANAPS